MAGSLTSILQCLGVYVLKCVGYDEAFQRKVFGDIKTWVSPPPKKPKDVSQKKPKTRKRKGAPEAVLDSDANVTYDDNSEEEFVEWIPRGTKSRPRS